MNKSLVFALVSALSIAPAAFAETTKADVAADVKAIKKDDAAIARQDANIAVNRDEKADAKAEGDVAAQASESVQIGANKTVKAVKQGEKKVDEKILEHDQKKVAQ